MDYQSELLFWVSIMRDHGMFQINALAPSEQKYIETSTYYRDFFSRMMLYLERTSDYRILVSDILQGLNQFIEYKKLLLKDLLACTIKMNLPPNLINHQINEAMEFQTILMKQECMSNMMNLAGYIKMWVADSIGHASAIASFLDPSEDLIQEEALRFKMVFGNLQIKASEIEMMMTRTGLNNGVLMNLANEAIYWMNKFIEYINKLRDLRANCEVMGYGTFSKDVLDHFIREHRYFIAKLKGCMN